MNICEQNMPVECLAHLFCVCMAIATGKVGPVFTGPIFQVGVNRMGISHGPAFSRYGFMLGSFVCLQGLWLCNSLP